MSTPTKQAPAKAAKPPVKRVAPIDYSALTATETERVERASSSLVHSTPFPKWMQESKDSGKAKVVTVPNTHATQTIGLIRSAANLLGIGSSVSSVVKGGNTTITFQAKSKRAYNPKSKD